jgi:hypothetical protein
MKAFRCSFDGINASTLEVGNEYEFGSMADGLKKAGLIGDVAPAIGPAESLEPAEPAIDLDAMKRAELDAFAAELGLDVSDAGNKGEVKAAIEAELARRAATPETPEA